MLTTQARTQTALPPQVPQVPQVPQQSNAKAAAGVVTPAPTEQKPPVQLRVAVDGVDKMREPTIDLSELGEPMLPPGDSVIADLPKHQQAAFVEGLVGTLSDLVSETFTAEALSTVADRAQTLSLNPEQSIVAALKGVDLAPLVDAALAGNVSTIAQIKEHHGADAGRFVANHQSQVFAFLTGLLTPSSSKPIFSMNETQLSQSASTLKELAPMLMQALQGKAPIFPPVLQTKWTQNEPTLPPAFASLFGAPGAQAGAPRDANAINATLHQLMVTGEAGLEFMIGLAGKLAQGDQIEHLKQLQEALEGLKKQKLGLMNKILAKEAEMPGSEFMAAVQAEKAREATEEARKWAIIGAVFTVVVAVVIAVAAVVVAVGSFGAAAPASAVAIGAAIGLSAGAIATAVTVAVIVAAACAVISAIMTITAQLPNLMRAAAMIMKEAGLIAMADSLEKKADDFEKEVTSKPWFQKLNRNVMITCGIIGALASCGASGSALQAGISLGSAALSAGVAYATYGSQKKMIEAQYAVTLLKGQLAKVEVAIKQLLSEIAKLRSREDFEQERVQASEESQSNIMKQLQACVQSLSEIRSAVAEV